MTMATYRRMSLFGLRVPEGKNPFCWRSFQISGRSRRWKLTSSVAGGSRENKLILGRGIIISKLCPGYTSSSLAMPSQNRPKGHQQQGNKCLNLRGTSPIQPLHFIFHTIVKTINVFFFFFQLPD